MRVYRLYAVTLLLGLAGCADVLGLGLYDTSATGSGGSGGTNSGGTNSGGSGGTSTGGNTGGTSTGGTATGGTTTTTAPMECEPGTEEACYEGPPGTDGIGECKSGKRSCNADGHWAPCDGVAPKIESCATLDKDENCDQLATCSGAYRWAKLFGAALDQSAHGVAVDRDGNVFVAGALFGALDLGGGALTSAGDADAFVAKLDRNGKHLWSKRFGDTGTERALAVAVDAAGNVFIAGHASSAVDLGGGPLVSQGGFDAFVAKLDPDGAHLWSKSYGSSTNENASSIAVDASGDVVLAGGYTSTLDLGGGPLPDASIEGDVFVAKLSGATGAHLWSRGFPAAGIQVVSTVRADFAGDVVLSGSSQTGVDFGGGPLPEGGLYDIFAVKLAGAGGAHLWSRSYTGPNDQALTGMGIGPDGSVAFVAQTNGPIDLGDGEVSGGGGFDACVWKVSKDGDLLWKAVQGDVGNDYSLGAAVDAEGNVIATFAFTGTLSFGKPVVTAPAAYDRAVIKFAPDGTNLWSRSFANSNSAAADHLTTDPLGNVLIATTLYGATNFGGGPLTNPSAAEADVLLVKLAP
jgi:hypothetical protein